MEIERRLSAFIRSAIEAEAASNYARMRRVPSTDTWKSVDYISTLSSSRRDALFDAFVANSQFLFDPNRDPNLHAASAKHLEFERFAQALNMMGGFSNGYKYLGVRSLRAILNDPTLKQSIKNLAQYPEEVLERAKAIQPTTATEMRRAVKELFGEVFEGTFENRGGGGWRFLGRYKARTFQVDLDYGHRFGTQVQYDLSYDDQLTGLLPRRLGYERMLGMGLCRWDSLTADNLQDSIKLMRDFVIELITIPERL